MGAFFFVNCVRFRRNKKVGLGASSPLNVSIDPPCVQRVKWHLETFAVDIFFAKLHLIELDCGMPIRPTQPSGRLTTESQRRAADGIEASFTTLIANEPNGTEVETRLVPELPTVNENSSTLASNPYSLAHDSGHSKEGVHELSHSELAVCDRELLARDRNHAHCRYDAITGRWTIFAAGRGERPSDFVTSPPSENTLVECPFCVGHEDQTPPSVLEISSRQCDSLSLDELSRETNPDEAHSGWAIRVIPNKYPAVDSPNGWEPDQLHSSTPLRREESSGSHALFRSRPVVGGHEVFIEACEHNQSFATIDLNQATMLLHAYQLRMLHYRECPAVQFISVFKNVGSAAGASLHHSHSQLIATSELPIATRAVADRMRIHRAKTGCCLQCDIIRAEIRSKVRVVAMTNSLIAYCPFGSHLPMMIRITTKRHLDCFEQLEMKELGELSRLVRGAIRWLQGIYPEVSYNFLINTRPPRIDDEEDAHWSMEIFPRVTQLAGFEWGSDCIINPVLPEDAAEIFRGVAKRENPLR